MDRAHHPSWIISTNRDQPKIEWSLEIANLLEGRTTREIVVLFAIVILAV